MNFYDSLLLGLIQFFDVTAAIFVGLLRMVSPRLIRPPRQRLYGDARTQEILTENDWSRFPELLAALSTKQISAQDFSPDERIDVDAVRVSKYKIIAAPQLLSRVQQFCELKNKVMSESGHRSPQRNCVLQEQMQVLDELLLVILPHVRLHSRALTLNDCICYGFGARVGAPFPHIHWDTDWLLFPDADGFQLWYLVDNQKDCGNMFIARTPHLLPSDPPVRFVLSRDGTVVKTFHDKRFPPECPLKIFASADACGLTFAYLAMQPGDCLIFSKRTLHMSDPRPHLRSEPITRLACEARIIIRPEGTDILPFWYNHPYAEDFPLHKRLAGQSRDTGVLKAIDRHEMSCFMDSFLHNRQV